MVTTLAGWVRAGQLCYELESLTAWNCPDALAGLCRGENKGKWLIRL
jgi:NADPH-dependent curcumin reductase CurA